MTASRVALESVRDAAFRAIRNLPEAHAATGPWRQTEFREATAALVDAVYHVDVAAFTDRHFEQLEDLAQAGVSLIRIHLVSLETSAADDADREYFNGLVARLQDALRGIEEGWHPDPAKRPSDEEKMQMLAMHLRTVI